MIGYVLNVAAGLSHLLNAVTGGKAHHSFSARTGASAIKGRRWARLAELFVDLLLFSPGHCRERAREEGLI